MDAFPFLSPLKDPVLVGSKSGFLLTSEDLPGITSKTWAWFLWTFLNTLPIRLEGGKAYPFRIPMTFKMHPCPWWMSPVSRKYNKEVGGRLETQIDLRLLPPFYCRMPEISLVLVSIHLSPSKIATGNLLLDSKPQVGSLQELWSLSIAFSPRSLCYVS